MLPSSRSRSHSYPPEAKAKQAKAKRNTHTLHRQQDETAVVYKRLASLIADKHSKLYSRTLHWLRCRINFSLLRSAIMCLRGSRSAAYRPASPLSQGDNVDLASSEGRVPNQDQIEYSCTLTLTRPLFLSLIITCLLFFLPLYDLRLDDIFVFMKVSWRDQLTLPHKLAMMVSRLERPAGIATDSPWHWPRGQIGSRRALYYYSWLA